ncbi:GntR family transcriptional regulator [Galactobacter valiniphilus]|uniref:GntR family transcriptional regulator n=2 Tax=Galactobacter valiniphilus TaxID=2676122 RepID=A0A399JEW5_9MICC|nr:GntR family transcriptional regulator [Galactobacter valiniphilus]
MRPMPYSTSPQRRLRAAVFSPLIEGGKVELVEDRIVRGIASGALHEGDRLPSEADMAASLGVATVTAREALAGLRRRGFVATRRGRDGGSYVTMNHRDRSELVLAQLAETTLVDLRDLALHYGVIASAAAFVAASMADPDDVDGVRRLAAADRGGEEADPGARAADLLLEMAALSHSARLTREFVQLHAEFGSYLRLAHEDPEFDTWSQAWGDTLVEALAGGDGDELRRLVQDYTRRAVALLITRRDALVAPNEPARAATN